jgi:riboflavin kinase
MAARNTNIPTTPTNQSARLGSKRISLPVGNDEVERLLLWRDVRKSGVVLAGITLIYILLEWSNLSLLWIVSNSLLAIVTLTFLWGTVASFTNKSGVPIPAFVRSGVSESQVRQFAETAVGPINKILAFVKRVLSGQDVVLSLQVALALYIFGYLGKAFTSLALVYTVVLLAFTIPKAYETKKDEVDDVLNSVQKQSTSIYKQYAKPYVQKIPRASTSTANTGSVTAGNHANSGDVADSYQHIPKPNFEAAAEPKKFT